MNGSAAVAVAGAAAANHPPHNHRAWLPRLLIHGCVQLKHNSSAAPKQGLAQPATDLSTPARVWLHVHSPLGWVQPVGLQSTFLAQQFSTVDVLITTIVAGAWLTLAVLVGHA